MRQEGLKGKKGERTLMTNEFIDALIHVIALRGQCCYHLHFTEEESEAKIVIKLAQSFMARKWQI